MRRLWLTSLILVILGPLEFVEAGPADGLLRLVSADSGVTLTVENLRERTVEVLGSPLYESLLRLNLVKTWMASGRFRQAEKSTREVMAALGLTPAALRDEILGDAFVLNLQSGPAARPDQSTGLLLIKPRDVAMVERLIKAINDAQHREGELVHVEVRSKGPVKYSARHFKDPARLVEFYLLLDDGTFGWSNSEAMILGIIDRKDAAGTGLADDPGFRKVRAGLPERALACLFVNPRFLEKAMAGAPRPATDRASEILSRYLGAVGLFGLALEWRDGIMLHSCESLAADKLDPWLRAWLSRPASPVTLPALVSPHAVAVVSANIDFGNLAEGLRELVPEDDRPSLENLTLALQGIMMGNDPIRDVLPRMGPGAVACIEIEPDLERLPHFPLVAAVGWTTPAGSENLSRPIDNALKTLCALYAYNPKRRMENLLVESRVVGDARLTRLSDGLRTYFAYRADRDRLVLGNSPEAVARFGSGQAPSLFSNLKTRYFPEAETFAIVDLVRLTREVRSLRGRFARALAIRTQKPVASALHDLNDMLALAELFQAATITTTSTLDASEVRRTVGLLAR